MSANPPSSASSRSQTPTPKKPALVHQSSHDRKTDRHIIWDEQVINEHNELRGTRTKIDEPKTPFHDYVDDASDAGSEAAVASPSNDVAMQWEALHDKLHEYSQQQGDHHKQPHDVHSNASYDGEDEDEKRQKKQHHDEFMKHRKEHYTEYEMLKRFRESHPYLDGDEEEDSKVGGDVSMQGN